MLRLRSRIRSANPPLRSEDNGSQTLPFPAELAYHAPRLLGGNMICSYCGAEVTDQKSTFCPRCGRPIAGPVLVTAPAVTNDLRGVSGWLLLVCVALTIGIPLLTVYNWVKFLSLGIGHIPW